MPGTVNPLSLKLAQLVRRLRRRLRLLLRGESPRHYFDLDDADLTNRVLTDCVHPPLDESPRQAAYRDGDLQRGEKLYELRDDVRREIPLALTPAQRGAYLDWFCRFGWDAIDTTPLDLLRVLFEEDAKPDRGLVASYLVQPVWQAKHPDGLTPVGWEPFKRWLAQQYGVRGRWLRQATLPHRYRQPSPPTDLGVNAIGLFRYTSGLQQAAFSVVNALEAAGVPMSLRDVPRLHNRDGRPRSGFDGLERYPITILNTGLDIPVVEAYRLAGLHPRSDVYRIAIWWWELEQLPAEWLNRGRDVDEIWAPTAFIANALRPLGKPVHAMLPSVRVPEFQPLPKSYFGLSPDRFTFLFVFDMNSRMPRKNPTGLIRAFRRAFRSVEPVELGIKVSPQEEYYADWWRELRTAARGNGVTLIDRSLGRSELLALMNAADAYVSLHRSEGFGLTMAEAMLLGKPTIATGYSGNLDFMTSESSYLVRYERTTIPEDIPPYPKGFAWAEPSEAHSAEIMRRVFDHRDEAATIADRGRRSAAALLSPEAAAARMIARLREIRGT